MKRRTIIWIVVGAITGMLLLTGSIGGIIYLIVSGTSAGAPTDAEKRLVVTTATLSRFGIEDLDPRYETCRSIRQFDGSRLVECQYSDGERPKGRPAVFMLSTAQISRTSLDARQTFHLSVATMRGVVALSGGDAGLEAAPSLLTIGDQNYSAFVTRKDQKVGNLFLTRKGRAVHRLLITGSVFEDPAEVRELLEPLLQESEGQFGSK